MNGQPRYTENNGYTGIQDEDTQTEQIKENN